MKLTLASPVDTCADPVCLLDRPPRPQGEHGPARARDREGEPDQPSTPAARGVEET